MTKIIRRLCTLLMALVIALLSLVNAIISINKFFETDSYLFMTNDYSNYGSARGIFAITSFFFTIVFFYILYMMCKYRGKLYDRLFCSYKVVGIMNDFNIVPEFVDIIVKRNGKYYSLDYFLELDSKNAKTYRTIKKFVRVRECDISKIKPLSDFNTNNYNFSKLIVGDKAIEAFQCDNNKVIVGTREELNEYLKKFENNNTMLEKILSLLQE